MTISVLQGRKILWVDNHHGTPSTPIDLLREGGAHLDLAWRIAEAIEYLANNDYDLAILDVDLPLRHGEEFPLTLRAIEKKYDLEGADPDNGILIGAWIFEHKRHVPFIFLSWFPEKLENYRKVIDRIVPRSIKCFRKDKTMLTQRFPNLIAHIIGNQADGQ